VASGRVGWLLRPTVSRQETDANHHPDAALGTGRNYFFDLRLMFSGGVREQFQNGVAEQLAAQRQLRFSMAVRQQAEVPDAGKALRQGVNQKAADEL
jgi:hypothetical protein